MKEATRESVECEKMKLWGWAQGPSLRRSMSEMVQTSEDSEQDSPAVSSKTRTIQMMGVGEGKQGWLVVLTAAEKWRKWEQVSKWPGVVSTEVANDLQEPFRSRERELHWRGEGEEQVAAGNSGSSSANPFSESERGSFWEIAWFRWGIVWSRKNLLFKLMEVIAEYRLMETILYKQKNDIYLNQKLNLS